ncbi:hypothetical protein BP00DRAFT_193597 [Aspergillus indologenus CBS 114.80]|uniref:2EXR domain-containing protein n=1 Tax=Aspergillus indologenus CBS 114.80 TaxID=1450541 RepID=A0A2V5II56_9EURO|nr:hypothetical protein BP00DRAFT_193597 [Aspergillus indologenus CBS 114.80]
MTELTSNPEFKKFSLLPAELRLKIWEDTLSEPVHLALYAYELGRWESSWAQTHLSLVFHAEELPHMLIDVPLFMVNREAQQAVKRWAQKQGIKIQYHPILAPNFAFRRPIDKDTDTLYVSQEDFRHFQLEPLNPVCSPFLTRLSFSFPIPRVAFPYCLLQHEKDVLSKVVSRDWGRITEVLVVMNGPSSVYGLLHDNDLDGGLVQQRWEWAAIPGAEEPLVWDPARRTFTPVTQGFWNSPEVSEREFRLLAERAFARAIESDGYPGDSSLKVRPVFVVG